MRLALPSLYLADLAQSLRQLPIPKNRLTLNLIVQQQSKLHSLTNRSIAMIDFFYAVTIGALFALGVFQLLRRDLVKAAMGFSLLFTGVNLFLLASGAFEGVAAPYTTNYEQGEVISDPLV